MRPYYDDWCDERTEPEEPEESVVCVCDNCGEDIMDCDDMAVVEEHRLDGRAHITHICMGCWEANGWDKAEELLDMIGIWYWTGDAADAMKIALDHSLKTREAFRKVLGTAAALAVSRANA